MSIEIKIILFQGIVIIPFITGFFLKSRISEKAAFSKRLVSLNIMIVDPLIVLWSIWGLSIRGQLAALPAAGVLLLALGFLFGKMLSPLLGFTGISRKTFLISSSLANIGFTMGGFICYLIAGEQGLGMAAIFASCFLPFVFLVVFPYAGRKDHSPVFALSYLRKQFINLQNMPLFAVFLALIMHALDISRPEKIFFPIDALIIISVIVYYFTLGINFNTRDLNFLKKEQLAMAAIKFVLVPAATGGVLMLVPLDPAIKKIILIQSFMPAAIYSVVTSILYDLDTEMASGIFVVNTILFIAAVLPVLFFCHGFGIF